MKKLLTPINIADIELPNRVIMAPLTRNRSNREGIPNEMMKIYYTQRASVGLIISEGTNISPQAVGYIDTPGIWSEKQIDGWKAITEAVHSNGGRIFMQLWHTGRSSHPDFHNGKPTVSASAINSGGRVKTYNGLKEKETPKELTIDEIKTTIEDYSKAARNAIIAGFDGVEAHGANGYLIDQFICSGSNKRNDIYGGFIENRTRFPLQVIQAICDSIGNSRTAIRLSPSGTFNGMFDETPVETFSYLVDKLNDFDMAYLHIMEPYAPPGKVYVPKENYLQDREVTPHFRHIYKGNLITNSGYSIEEAENIIKNGTADMVAFGKLILSNPDLVERIGKNKELNVWDTNTFYTNGEKGYIDYPFLK